MQRLKLLVLFVLLPMVSNAQHWSPLPFKFDMNGVYYIADDETDSLYIIGQYNTVNGTATDAVRWDGGAGITYLTLLNNCGGCIEGITTYQGKQYISTAGVIYRKDATGLFATNNITYRETYGTVRWGDRLVTLADYYDSTYKFTGVHWDVWDGTKWKDTLRYDTLWPGDNWRASYTQWYKGELYVGGNINPGNHPEFSEILRFDGTRWKDVGGGIKGGSLGYVAQLTVWKGDLYACGSFDESQGAPGNGIARWDGMSWHRLGDGLWRANGSGAGVRSMAVYNDELYAVGLFDHAGGLETNGIAKWDGQKWCVISDKFENGTHLQIIAHKNQLYLSGTWHSINGDTSFNQLAKWAGGAFGDTCSAPLSVYNPVLSAASIIYPNPASNVVFIGLTDISAASIYDMQGRLVSKTNSYARSNGMDVSKLSPGIYTLRIETSSGIVTRRLVKD